MTEADQTLAPGRPRRWWLAMLLNLLTPPAGYAYVGAWRLAGGLLIVLLVGPVALMAWTFARPPGIYGWDVPAIAAWSWAPLVALAAHAAWLSRHATAPSGARWAHGGLYVAIGLTPYLIGGGLRALSPQSTYSAASASMEPSLRMGDILGVRGARIVCGLARPRAGDVVVYRRSGQGDVSYMHRAVAGPGQTVAMEAGRLLIDGVRVRTEAPVAVRIPIPGSDGDQPATIVREVLANGASYATFDFGPDGMLDNMSPRRLGPGEWFMLGDSRDNALDSRAVGPISSRSICGIADRILQAKDKSRVGAKP